MTFAANLHAALADPHVELFEFCTLPNPLRDAMRVEPVALRGRAHRPADRARARRSCSPPRSSASSRSRREAAMSSADARVPARSQGDDRLTTAILSDSCDAAGLRHQVLQERLAPVVPGSRAIGRARTVRFAPSLADDPDDPYGDAIDVIGSIGAGQLVVIATDREQRLGVLGRAVQRRRARRGRGRAWSPTATCATPTRIAALGLPGLLALPSADRLPGAASHRRRRRAGRARRCARSIRGATSSWPTTTASSSSPATTKIAVLALARRARDARIDRPRRAARRRDRCARCGTATASSEHSESIDRWSRHDLSRDRRPPARLGPGAGRVRLARTRSWRRSTAR